MHRLRVNGKYEDIKFQKKLLKRLSYKANIRIVKERKFKNRNIFEEWFRYIELIHNGLKKHLN